MRYVERVAVREKQIIYEKHEPKEGFLGIRPEDFHNICDNGCAQLRIFRCQRNLKKLGLFQKDC